MLLHALLASLTASAPFPRPNAASAFFLSTHQEFTMPVNRVIQQKNTSQGGSAPQKTATGSGSRPTGGKYKIDSSNPAYAQMIRPKNKLGD